MLFSCFLNGFAAEQPQNTKMLLIRQGKVWGHHCQFLKEAILNRDPGQKSHCSSVPNFSALSSQRKKPNYPKESTWHAARQLWPAICWSSTPEGEQQRHWSHAQEGCKMITSQIRNNRAAESGLTWLGFEIKTRPLKKGINLILKRLCSYLILQYSHKIFSTTTLPRAVLSLQWAKRLHQAAGLGKQRTDGA